MSFLQLVLSLDKTIKEIILFWRICQFDRYRNTRHKGLFKACDCDGEFFPFQIFLDNISPFCGPLIPLFWTSGSISSGFQIHQSRQPYSCLVGAYMLHVPQDSPLVWHLPTSWWPVWQPSYSLPCSQALVWLQFFLKSQLMGCAQLNVFLHNPYVTIKKSQSQSHRVNRPKRGKKSLVKTSFLLGKLIY